MENKDDVDRLDIHFILQIVQDFLNLNPDESDIVSNTALLEEIYSKMKEFRQRKHA